LTKKNEIENSMSRQKETDTTHWNHKSKDFIPNKTLQYCSHWIKSLEPLHHRQKQTSTLQSHQKDPWDHKSIKFKPLSYIIPTQMIAAPITTHPNQDTHNKPAT
jgi:hypothetical protein